MRLLTVLLSLSLLACTKPAQPEAPPPLVAAITVVPVSDAELPELAAAFPAVQAHFPGLRLTLAERRPLPQGVRTGAQVSVEGLFGALPGAPGDVYVVAEDLGTQTLPHVLSMLDPRTGRGVLSLSRLRDEKGEPTVPPVAQQGEALARSVARTEFQVTATVAKLIGVRFPCRKRECALARFNDVRDIDARGTRWCNDHAGEVPEQIARVKAVAAGQQVQHR